MKTKSVESQFSKDMSEQKPKSSKLAIISLVCGLLAFALPIGLMIFADSLHWLLPPLSFSTRKALEEVLGRIIVIGSPIVGITALITGLIGLLNIKLKKGAIKGAGKAVLGTLLGLLFFAIVGFLLWGVRVREGTGTRFCAMNMLKIAKAIQVYSNEYKQYPTSDKWCDLLKKQHDLTDRDFFCNCSHSKYGVYPISHYAINPNAENNSPPDLVLLFETKVGWNQVGGPELLSAKNHRGKGCNILFNDGHVEFVKKKQFEKLKWKVNEVNTSRRLENENNKQ